MGAFDKYIAAVEQFISSTDQIILEAVEEHERDILDLNREMQLYILGEDSRGEKVTPPYTPYTVYLKRQKGQPYDRVTLQDTGAFHRSFRLKIREKDFIIGATDEKTRKLVAKYGVAIFGLNDEHVEQVAEDIAGPALEEALKKALDQ